MSAFPQPHHVEGVNRRSSALNVENHAALPTSLAMTSKGLRRILFTKCAPEQTRAEVRCCFDAAGAGGGFILNPSDHFFEVALDLLRTFGDEARNCVY